MEIDLNWNKVAGIFSVMQEISLNLLWLKLIEDLKHDAADLVIAIFLRDGVELSLLLFYPFFLILCFM